MNFEGFRAIRLSGLAALLAASPCPARADDPSKADPGVADKSGYSLLDPTPDDLMRKFTPDRPTKGYSVRTIDAGHFELETDLVSYAYSKYQGITSRSFEVVDPTLKVGVTDWADLELQLNGLQFSRSYASQAAANVTSGEGFGDVYLRAKMNLFGNDSGPAGLALIPYVKLPSSVPIISNGAIEAGLIAPLALRLAQDYLVTLMTELDGLKNADDRRRYANFVNLVGVSHPLPAIDGANVTFELYSAAGTDRATPAVYTFDVGANFRLDQHTILDVGLNLGLNRAAPALQIYSGMSVRF